MIKTHSSLVEIIYVDHKKTKQVGTNLYGHTLIIVLGVENVLKKTIEHAKYRQRKKKHSLL